MKTVLLTMILGLMFASCSSVSKKETKSEDGRIPQAFEYSSQTRR